MPEIERAARIIREVFMEFEAPEYSLEGGASFFQFANEKIYIF